MLNPEWEKNPLLLMGFMALMLFGLATQDFIPPCYITSGVLWALSAVCAIGMGVSQWYGHTRLQWFFTIAIMVAGFVAIGLDLMMKLAEHGAKIVKR